MMANVTIMRRIDEIEISLDDLINKFMALEDKILDESFTIDYNNKSKKMNKNKKKIKKLDSPTIVQNNNSSRENLKSINLSIPTTPSLSNSKIGTKSSSKVRNINDNKNNYNNNKKSNDNKDINRSNTPSSSSSSSRRQNDSSFKLPAISSLSGSTQIGNTSNIIYNSKQNNFLSDSFLNDNCDVNNDFNSNTNLDNSDNDMNNIHLVPKLLFNELKQLTPNFGFIKLIIQKFPEWLYLENESNSIALHVACSNIDNITVGILDLLIENNKNSIKNYNVYQNTALHIALQSSSYYNNNHINIYNNIKKIIDTYPLACNHKNIDYQLPLHIACNNYKDNNLSYEIIKYLLYINSQSIYNIDKYGQLPIHKICNHKIINMNIIELLVVNNNNKDTIKIKDNFCMLPIHLLCCKINLMNIEIIKKMIEIYPESLFEFDSCHHLPYDKLLRNDNRNNFHDIILDFMKITRNLILEEKNRHLKRVPSPILLDKSKC
jgi:hypothetical protein